MRLVQVGTVLVQGEHQKPQVRHFARQAAAEHDAVELGHRYVEHGDVRALLANDFQRAQSARGFADQLEILFRPDQIAQAIEDDGMVVGKDDAGFLGHAADLWPSSAMRAKIVVPAPTADSMSSVPPINIKRPRMPSSPRPR